MVLFNSNNQTKQLNIFFNNFKISFLRKPGLEAGKTFSCERHFWELQILQRLIIVI